MQSQMMEYELLLAYECMSCSQTRTFVTMQQFHPSTHENIHGLKD